MGMALRMTTKEIENNWSGIVGELEKNQRAGEFSVVIGDLNKNVSNLISNNKPKLSFGGKLISNLLDTNKYILVNDTDKASGGLVTRISKAEPNKSSALDLAIASSGLFEYVEKLDIESELKFTPGRNDGNNNMKYSDHRIINQK